jgi:Protein of unknown function (DUF3489)
MTVEYPFTLAQLAQILSALENERRNPNTKRNAIKAIERNAAQIGLTAEDVFNAADGLLSGRMGAAAFRAALRDEGCGPTTVVTKRSAEPAAGGGADEPAEAYLMPNAGPLAPTAEDAHAVDDIPPFLRREPVHASGEEPAPLVMPKRRSDKPRQHRDGTKEALVIAMLRRPDGATIAQIMHETGWQAHTVRGAFAGALKKKRGLTVISEKPEGGERIYRLAE